MFSNLEIAEQFSFAALRTSQIYVADEDRFAMQSLAELLKRHIARGILNVADLYRTEQEVISLLNNDSMAAADWERFRKLRHICSGSSHPEARIVIAKKRYINPYILGKGRISDCSAPFAEALRNFLETPLDKPLWGE